MLDPRSLPPVQTTQEVLGAEGFRGTLALLSQTVADGSRYAKHLDDLVEVDASDHVETLRRLLGPASIPILEHVHETSKWFGSLLDADSARQEGDSVPRLALAAYYCTLLRHGWKRLPQMRDGQP